MITQEELKKLLHYDPDTGVFTWIKCLSNRVRSGEVTRGAVSKHCGKYYRRIGIDGRRYFEHRLAWLYVYGAFPKEQIDHINGDGQDNRIENLRGVTHQQNGSNVRKSEANTSGVTGVYARPTGGKWCAEITVFQKKKHLGTFNSLEEAALARKQAETELGFHANHGSERPL